jgi:hypothetical protein
MVCPAARLSRMSLVRIGRSNSWARFTSRGVVHPDHVPGGQRRRLFQPVRGRLVHGALRSAITRTALANSSGVSLPASSPFFRSTPATSTCAKSAVATVTEPPRSSSSSSRACSYPSRSVN